MEQNQEQGSLKKEFKQAKKDPTKKQLSKYQKETGLTSLQTYNYASKKIKTSYSVTEI